MAYQYLPGVAFVFQVVQIVSALHAVGIVHYDIKCDNLLLSAAETDQDAPSVRQSDTDTPGNRQGSQPTPSGTSPNCISDVSASQIVLADFGEAIVFHNKDDAYTHRNRGTELFNSPEMLMLAVGAHNRTHADFDRRKNKGAGFKHDVWSLGCTLYELLTGLVLFEDEVSGPSIAMEVAFVHWCFILAS